MVRKPERRTATSGKQKNQSGAKKKSKSRLAAATSRGRVKKRTPQKSARQQFDPSLPSNYARLTLRQREIYDRATAVASDLRRGAGLFPDLCLKHGITKPAAQRYLGRDLIGAGERARAPKSDKRVRNLLFPLPQGDLPVQTQNSRDATT